MIFPSKFPFSNLLWQFSLILLVVSAQPAKAFTIFMEDFNDPADQGQGAIGVSTSAPPTIDTSGVDFTVNVDNASLTAPTDFFQVQNNRFEAQDTDGEAIFTSPIIDISNFTDVSFSIDFTEFGDLEETGIGLDFVNVEFIIDGTTTLIPNQNGFPGSPNTLLGNFTDDLATGATPVSTISQTGLAGNNLQIAIGIQNLAGAELTVFDNILVEGTEIPFEFSPGLGLLILGIVFSGNHILKRLRQKITNNF